jgi:hypothetical protein
MEAPCFWMERGQCRFGWNCIWFHPDLPPRPWCEQCGSNFCAPVIPFVCFKCIQIQEDQKNECRHYKHGYCFLKDMCVRSHGPEDTRAMCYECGVGRCKPENQYCWNCHQNKRRHHNRFGCRFFDHNSCNHGEECFREHGLEDERLLCEDCEVRRVPNGSAMCSKCSKNTTKKNYSKV